MDAPPGTRVVVSFFGVDACVVVVVVARPPPSSAANSRDLFVIRDVRARIDDAVAAVLRCALALLDTRPQLRWRQLVRCVRFVLLVQLVLLAQLVQCGLFCPLCLLVHLDPLCLLVQ